MAVIDKSLFIRQIQAREEMYVIFSAATNMPLVVCDPDTFDDQVWIFENEEQAIAVLNHISYFRLASYWHMEDV